MSYTVGTLRQRLKDEKARKIYQAYLAAVQRAALAGKLWALKEKELEDVEDDKRG